MWKHHYTQLWHSVKEGEGEIADDYYKRHDINETDSKILEKITLSIERLKIANHQV